MMHSPRRSVVKCQREITSVVHLPYKPRLKIGASIRCRVTGVVSPTEFYVRSTDICQSVCRKILKPEEEEESLSDDGGNQGFYYDGSCFMDDSEVEERISGARELFTNFQSVTESLTKFLEKDPAIRRKLTRDFYSTRHELVAVNLDSMWMRAITLPTVNENVEDMGKTRVHLLDTGEVVKVLKRDMCALPKPFSVFPAEAFHCALFGVSPVWLVWSPAAIKMLDDLQKDVEIVVKNKVQTRTSTFEHMPYLVEVLVKDGSDCDSISLADTLVKGGYALRWSKDPKSFKLTKPKELEEYEKLKRMKSLNKDSELQEGDSERISGIANLQLNQVDLDLASSAEPEQDLEESDTPDIDDDYDESKWVRGKMNEID